MLGGSTFVPLLFIDHDVGRLTSATHLIITLIEYGYAAMLELYELRIYCLTLDIMDVIYTSPRHCVRVPAWDLHFVC